MNQIILGWQNVLTDFVNQTYGRQYDASDLDFKHNPFYTPVKGRKVIDVFPANAKHIHNGLLNIEPFDPAKFFANIPLMVYADEDSTGSQIIDILSDSYGVVFDKSIDFDKSFLDRLYRIDSTARDVTITFASTSMIWEGSFKVTTVSRGSNLAKEVINRALDALIIPDITETGTQSLRLITTPLVITNPTLIRKFSGSEPVVLENDTLTALMEEIVAQRIVDASDAGELEDLFRGRTVTSHETGDEGYDRYMETVDSLENSKWSGKPRFKFKSVKIETDVTTMVGEIVVADLPDQDAIKIPAFFTAAGYWQPYIVNLLEEQIKLYPAKHDDIMALINEPIEDVWLGMTRNVNGAALNDGKATIYLETVPNGKYSGRLAITFPLPNFAIKAEDGSDLDKEKDNGVIAMETKYIVAETIDGTLIVTNGNVPVESSTVDEASMMGLMLFNSTMSAPAMLKPTVVVVPDGDGHIYTEPSWPDVEVRVVKKP